MYGLKHVLFSENIPLLLYHCWAKVFCFIASFLRIFFSFTYWCLLFVLVLLLNTIMIFVCEDFAKKGFKLIIRFDIREPLSALLFCSEIDVSIMQTDISIVQFLVLYCKYSIGDQIRFQDKSHTSSSIASRFLFFSDPDDITALSI